MTVAEQARHEHALATLTNLAATLIDQGASPHEVRRATARGIEISKARCRETEPGHPNHVCAKVPANHKGPHRTRFGRTWPKEQS